MNWKTRNILEMVSITITTLALIFTTVFIALYSDEEKFNDIWKCILVPIFVLAIAISFGELRDIYRRYKKKVHWCYTVYNSNLDIINQGVLENYTISEAVEHIKKQATSKIIWSMSRATYYDPLHNKIIIEKHIYIDKNQDVVNGEYY